MMTHLVFTSFVAICIHYVASRIEEIPLPLKIQTCFDRTHGKGNLSTLIGEKIVWHCVHGSLWSQARDSNEEIPAVAMKWFADLIHKSYREAEQNRRVKRQAFRRPGRQRQRPRQLRIRREYRMLSDRERNNYHRAVLMLKRDRSIPPNRYDALGRLHELLGERSHDGPNFLGWHRFFLIVAENALREKIPSITIPFWDSTLDGGLEDPRASIIWSANFLGNGNGYLKTGPFTGWTTPYGPLIRNYGDGGTMMNWTSIRDSFSRSHIGEITHPNADPKHNIEDHHGEPHLWVGGHMSPQALAGYDPIFLMHHSFMDLVWELFRRIQRRRGVDPTTDYPRNNTGPPGHGYHDPSGFGNLLNRHSLSDIFTTEMYTYQLPPTCTHESPSCGSPYIKCDTSGRRARCVSTSVFDIPTSEIFNVDNLVATPNIRRKRNVDLPGKFRSRLLNKQQDVSAYIKQIESVMEVKCQPENINAHYTNNFNMDGKTSQSLWSYIPINVIVQQNRIQEKNENEKAASYSKCQDGRKLPYRVFLESNGLSYRGFYKEIVHVQTSVPVSSTVSFVAFKTPTSTPSDVIVSAYDSCGRVCKIYCQTNNGSGYRTCAGGLRISNNWPIQYGANITSVSKLLWRENINGLPDLYENELFVKVVCNAEPEWPWIH